jgi:hypothetical protein
MVVLWCSGVMVFGCSGVRVKSDSKLQTNIVQNTILQIDYQ